MITLQVLVCTLGRSGIERVMRSQHPETAGVEYLIAWQQPDEEIDVPEELLRDDIHVFITRTCGISRNRNYAISCATAPLCLMSDDDVDFTAEELQLLIRTFESNPLVELMTIKYRSHPNYTKNYPSFSFDLRKPPRGYYVTAFEIAFRREAVIGRVKFCENISLGTPVLRCGEEDVFIKDVLDANIKSYFFPITVGTHAHSTTAERDASAPYFLMTKGAVFSYIHHRTWLFRLIVNAWRARKRGIPFTYFMKHTLAGVRYARRNNVFSHRTP